MKAWPNGQPPAGTRASRTKLVTTADIEMFTRITGDRNPLHYDEELARRSRFGGIIVQGGVTSGLLNAVVAEQLPGPGTVFLSVNWRFVAPVRAGATITAHVELISARADKPIATLSTRVVDEHDRSVLEGTAVCFTDPVVAAAEPVEWPSWDGR